MARDPFIFVGTLGQGIFRSDDGGLSFVRKSVGMNFECDVRAMAVHAQNPRLLYAGTNEGLYRSDDAGEHWARLDSPMNHLVTWCVLVDPRRPDVLFAGTRPARIFRSTDAGRNWVQLDVAIAQHCDNLVYNRVTTLLPDPNVFDGLWAGIEIDGVWQSSDLGETWSRHNAGLSSLDIHSMVIVPRDGASRCIFASTNNDLNLSTDEGRIWQPQSLQAKFELPYFRGTAQKSDDASVLLLGNGDAPPGRVGALWRSGDGGVTWRKAQLPCVPNSTIWGFAVHPADPDRIYTYSVSGELYGSVDGGIEWEKLPREFGEIRAVLWTPA
jgi:photosystem II stability/assembly factor-like uncharacterized protein